MPLDPNSRTSAALFLSTLVVLSGLSLGVALISGSDGVRPDLLAQFFSDSLTANDTQIVERLRLPRALSAFAVGGLLAIAGVLMQVLLRNPLADPYILGTSGGAACGALGAMLLGATVGTIDLAAFVGAALATLIVFGTNGLRGMMQPALLLLTGVVLASGFGAIVSLMLALSPDASVRGMLFWLMGDFSLALTPAPALAVLLVATIVVLCLSRALDVLSEAPKQAVLLGLPLLPMRVTVLLIASVLTAFAVTRAGAIGFVGLVIPHLVRGFTGVRHALLVPASALAGGSLLVLADTLSRTILAPRQLPVGTLMAMIGVPLFLYLLRRQLPSAPR